MEKLPKLKNLDLVNCCKIPTSRLQDLVHQNPHLIIKVVFIILSQTICKYLHQGTHGTYQIFNLAGSFAELRTFWPAPWCTVKVKIHKQK